MAGSGCFDLLNSKGLEQQAHTHARVSRARMFLLLQADKEGSSYTVIFTALHLLAEGFDAQKSERARPLAVDVSAKKVDAPGVKAKEDAKLELWVRKSGGSFRQRRVRRVLVITVVQGQS